MACHLSLARAGEGPRDIALPPDELLPIVAWDVDRGVFLLRDPVKVEMAAAAANEDEAPPIGRGLVRLPPAQRWAWNIAPEDADALMRSVAAWAAMFAGCGFLAWRWA